MLCAGAAPQLPVVQVTHWSVGAPQVLPQHSPATQNPLAHWALEAQGVPTGFPPQLPATHERPKTH